MTVFLSRCLSMRTPHNSVRKYDVVFEIVGKMAVFKL